MSTTLTKKQQKAQSFRTKGGKGGKKEAPVPEDVPEQDLLDDEDGDDNKDTGDVSLATLNINGKDSQKTIVDLNSTTEPDGRKKSKSKLSKEKKLREKLAREAELAHGKPAGETSAGQKRKREEDVKPVAKVEKGKNKAIDADDAGKGEAMEVDGEEGKEKKKTKKDIKQRFILFVGEFAFFLLSSNIDSCEVLTRRPFCVKFGRPPIFQDDLFRTSRLFRSRDRPFPLRPPPYDQTTRPAQVPGDRVHRVPHFLLPSGGPEIASH